MPAVYGKEGLYWVNGISHLAGIAMIQTCLESLLPIKCPIDILSRSLPHPVVLERKTIGHNLNRNHNLAKSQWLEHLAHAEVCHKHLEQLGLRKRKLFDCLQNIFVLHLLLFNELAVGKPFANPLVDSDSLYLFSSLSSVQHLSEEVLLVDRERVVLPASELPLDPTIQERGLRGRLLRKIWTVESWKCDRD